MLVKRSSKNQIAIPKAVLERAGLAEDDDYFDVEYERGRIVLIPMHVEEKISAETMERFETKALRRNKGDKVYPSMGETLKGLRPPRR